MDMSCLLVDQDVGQSTCSKGVMSKSCTDFLIQSLDGLLDVLEKQPGLSLERVGAVKSFSVRRLASPKTFVAVGLIIILFTNRIGDSVIKVLKQNRALCTPT